MKQLINFFLTSLLLANHALAEPKVAAQARTTPESEAPSTETHTITIPESTPVQTIILSEDDLYSVRTELAANPEDSADEANAPAQRQPTSPAQDFTPPAQTNLPPETASTQRQAESLPEPQPSTANTAKPTESEVFSAPTLTLSEPETDPATIESLYQAEASPAQLETLPAHELPAFQYVAQSDAESTPAAASTSEPETASAPSLTLSAPEMAPVQTIAQPTPEQFVPVQTLIQPAPEQFAAEAVTAVAAPTLSESNNSATQAPANPLSKHAPIQAAPIAPQAEVIILKNPDNLGNYMLSPGDALEITVWKEEGLQQLQFLIGPDGNIIYPLIGTITAAGRTLNDLKELITFKLADYIADPSISLKLINNQGNAVFVIGKVNKPGQVVASRRIDVLQALSLAGGLTVFANQSNITIQRRVGNEVKVFPFDYGDVIDGEDLEQNILLEPGDTIAVP